MSYFDTGNDVYECTTVYLCKKCDDAKPLEDFYNKWDDKTNEENIIKLVRNVERRQKQQRKETKICLQQGQKKKYYENIVFEPTLRRW